MVLNIYKEQLDKLDLIAVANEFIGESEHCKGFLLELHMHISSYYSCIVLDLASYIANIHSYVTATLII